VTAMRPDTYRRAQLKKVIMAAAAQPGKRTREDAAQIMGVSLHTVSQAIIAGVVTVDAAGHLHPARPGQW